MRTLITKIKDTNLPWILYFLLSLIYFSSRIPFVWQLPLFEDEALFTGWSVEMFKGSGNFTKPISQGISPLFSWLTFSLLPFTANQFLAGRFVSVLAGFFLTLLVYSILQKNLNLTYTCLLTIIYIFLPIMFVYNRLGILDSLVVFLSLAAIFFSYRFLKSFAQKDLFFYTSLLILALLSKQIAAIIIPAVILASIYTSKGINRKILFLLWVSIVSLITVFLFFYPFRYKSVSFLSDYVFIPVDLNQSTAHFKKNIWLTWHWLISYYPSSLLAGTLLGGVLAFVKGAKIEKFFLVVFVISFISIIVTSKLYFPRHTLLFAPFLVIFLAVFFKELLKLSPWLAVIMVFIIMIQIINSNWIMVSKPESNNVMAKEDIFQLYEDWTSGKRLPAIANYLDKEAETFNHIKVWVDSTKLYYYGLPFFLQERDKISIKKAPEKEEFIQSIRRDKTAQFFIANKDQYNIEFILSKDFPVSQRHLVKVLRLK